MKLTLQENCFGSTTRIDGEYMEDIDVKKLREIANELIKNSNRDEIEHIICDYIERCGEITQTHHCNTCGTTDYAYQLIINK